MCSRRSKMRTVTPHAQKWDQDFLAFNFEKPNPIVHTHARLLLTSTLVSYYKMTQTQPHKTRFFVSKLEKLANMQYLKIENLNLLQKVGIQKIGIQNSWAIFACSTSLVRLVCVSMYFRISGPYLRGFDARFVLFTAEIKQTPNHPIKTRHEETFSWSVTHHVKNLPDRHTKKKSLFCSFLTEKSP